MQPLLLMLLGTIKIPIRSCILTGASRCLQTMTLLINSRLRGPWLHFMSKSRCDCSTQTDS